MTYLPSTKRRMRARHALAGIAILVSAAALVACGGNAAAPVDAPNLPDLGSNAGSGNTSSSAPGTSPLAVSGRVINVGYLGNTRVCVDVNDNNACEVGEPATTTDASGRYALATVQGLRGVHVLAEVRPASVDTAYATTAAGANPIQQGWLMAAALEYAPGSTAVTANVTPLSTTYLMRLMSQGHLRLSNRVSVLTRAGKTDDLGVGADFDYVASPVPGLGPSLARLTDYLSTRAAAAGTPAPLIDTAAVLSAWYGTYNASTNPIMDVAKFTPTTPATIATNLDTYGYRYYHTKADIATELRGFMVDKGNIVRSGGALQSLTSQGFRLANGAFQRVFQQFTGGTWTDVSFAEDAYLTLDAAGAVQLVSGTDYLQPRAVTAIDGNDIVYRMPVNGVRYSVELANDRFFDFHIYDWAKNAQQLTPALYAYTKAPSVRPACAADYNTGVPSTSTSPDAWYASCNTYYLYQYMGGLAGYKTLQDPTAKSEFYDETLLDPLVKLPLVHPLIADCAAAGRATVAVAGAATCNTMTGDAGSAHVRGELFAPAGITVESWTMKDPAVAAPAVSPRKLRLVLGADGTGTISGLAASSVAGYTTGGSAPVDVTADVSVVTEAVLWSADPANADVVLVRWAPLAPTDSARALAAHFANADFTAVPSSPANPRYNQLAIGLRDGVFISGEYYAPGYTNNFTADVYKRMNRRALEIGTGALNYVVGKLYAEAGFQ